MCLELIADFLNQVEDRFICMLDDHSNLLRSQLSSEQQHLLTTIEELHRQRAREITKTALLAGVAMGRGLAEHLTGPDR